MEPNQSLQSGIFNICHLVVIKPLYDHPYKLQSITFRTFTFSRVAQNQGFCQANVRWADVFKTLAQLKGRNFAKGRVADGQGLWLNKRNQVLGR